MKTIFDDDHKEADKAAVKKIVRAVRKEIISQVKEAIKNLDKQKQYDGGRSKEDSL